MPDFGECQQPEIGIVRVVFDEIIWMKHGRLRGLATITTTGKNNIQKDMDSQVLAYPPAGPEVAQREHNKSWGQEKAQKTRGRDAALNIFDARGG